MKESNIIPPGDCNGCPYENEEGGQYNYNGCMIAYKGKLTPRCATPYFKKEAK